jgi:hypothetical protein
MTPDNINSGADYAQLVIDTIIGAEKEIPADQQMPIALLTHLTNIIEVKADKHWIDYVSGKRESFLFTEDEMTDMFNKAGEKYVSDMLDEMVDKEVLEVSIDDKGELLYGLTEKGKKALDEEEG